MFTYFVIGIIVQSIVLIERAIRFPWVYEKRYTYWIFWASLIVFSTINVLAWPITIVSEIYNVANGQ